MDPARNLEAATSHSYKPHQSSSVPSSNLQLLDWTGYKRSLDAAETNFDVATTHKGNDELRESLVVQKFFDEVRQIISLVDDDKRKWIGSLLSEMTERAILLSTDDDTGTDFQSYFSYTWMRALHTAGTRSAKIVDPYVHSLVHVTDSGDLNLISEPNIVIPLGKLFIHKDGHSTWTGYEILVSNNLNLWIIDILDEIDPQELYPDEVRRSRRYIPGSVQDEQTEVEKSPSVKIARLWDSLQALPCATFEKAGEEIRKFYYKDFVGSIYLLELSRTMASRAISLSDKLVHKTFATSKFKISAESKAGRELLLLANDNAKMAIMKLILEEQAEPIDTIDRQLMSLAVEHEEEVIVKLLLENGNVNVNSVDELGKTPLSYAIVNAAKHAAKTAAETATSGDAAEFASKGFIRQYLNSISNLPDVANAIKQNSTFATNCAAKYAAESAAMYATSSTVSAIASLFVSTAAYFAAYIFLEHFSQEASKDAAKDAAEYAAEYAMKVAEAYVDVSTGEDVVNEYLPEDVIRRAIRKAVLHAFPDLISEDPYAYTPSVPAGHIRMYAIAYTAEYHAQYASEFNNDRILKLLKKYEQTQRRDKKDIRNDSNLAG